MKHLHQKKYFLNNDKIIVIGKRYEYDKKERKIELMKIFYIQIIWIKHITSAKLYNVKDKLTQHWKNSCLEGDYLTARMIGSNVYIASNKYILCIYMQSMYKSTELNEDDFKPHFRIQQQVMKQKHKLWLHILYSWIWRHKLLKYSSLQYNNNQELKCRELFRCRRRNICFKKKTYMLKNKVWLWKKKIKHQLQQKYIN